MKKKRPKWYTVDQLAECWRCHRDLIYYYIETGELKLSARFTHEEFGDSWATCPLEDYDDVTAIAPLGAKLKGKYILLQEVERFEKTHEQAMLGGKEKNQIETVSIDKASEMVKQLQLEGVENHQIARKLKDIYPNIKPAKIGRLITEDLKKPYVTYHAYRKRGVRLLEKTAILIKPTIQSES